MIEQQMSEILDFVESKDLIYLDTCFLYGGPTGKFPAVSHKLTNLEKESDLVSVINQNIIHTIDLLKRNNCYLTCKVLLELDHHISQLEKKYSDYVEEHPVLNRFMYGLENMRDVGFDKIRMPQNGKHYGLVLKSVLKASHDIKGPFETRNEDSLADEEIVTSALCTSLSEGLKVGICSSDVHIRKLLSSSKRYLNGNVTGNCDLYMLL